MYNPELINAAVYARAKMARTCRKIAAQYAPVPLPDYVIVRICTRRKLYNYLAALDHNHASIQAIFWQHDLSVPRDRSLRPSSAVDPDAVPGWLRGEGFDAAAEWNKQNADMEPADLNDCLEGWNI